MIIDNFDWEAVNPNVIYNRFDLQENEAFDSFGVMNINQKNIPFAIQKNQALLGTYLMNLEIEDIIAASKEIFECYMGVLKVSVFRSIVSGYKKTHNDWHIDLPQSKEELDARLSKKGRYNIKRELRLINDEIGATCFQEYNLKETSTDEIVKFVSLFFKMKMKTHHRNYEMSPLEYIKKYHVSNIYILMAGEIVLSMVLSCEQCPVTYIENLTYDKDYAKYSPGQVLYDWYLKRLIAKNKRALFLSGGQMEYKQRYGSIESYVCDIDIYRKSVKGYGLRFKEMTKSQVKYLYMKLPPNQRLKVKSFICSIIKR